MKTILDQKDDLYLTEETLSDGSKVYNIEILSPITLHLENYDQAWELFDEMVNQWT